MRAFLCLTFCAGVGMMGVVSNSGESILNESEQTRRKR